MRLSPLEEACVLHGDEVEVDLLHSVEVIFSLVLNRLFLMRLGLLGGVRRGRLLDRGGIGWVWLLPVRGVGYLFCGEEAV